jgi:hypothetical protein
MCTDYSQSLSKVDEIQNFDPILDNEKFSVVYNREQDTFWYADANEIYQIDLIASFSPYKKDAPNIQSAATLFPHDWAGVYEDERGHSQYVLFRKRTA